MRLWRQSRQDVMRSAYGLVSVKAAQGQPTTVTKTAGAKTRNDANYAFASRRRAIAALSSMP